MTSSFQRQYTQALLGSKPTDFHSKLWEWYEKEDKPKREKWLQQNAENENRTLKIQENESFVELAKTVKNAATPILSAIAAGKKADKLHQAKKKKDFLSMFDGLERGEGTQAKEMQFFEEVEQYRLRKDEIFKDGVLLKSLTANLPPEVQAAYEKLDASTIIHAREYMGLRALGELNIHQYRQELSTAGKLMEFDKSENQTDQFLTWRRKKLAPYALSNGLFGDVLSKELKRSASTTRGVTKTAQIAKIQSEDALRFAERLEAKQLGNDTSQGLFVHEELSLSAAKYEAQGRAEFEKLGKKWEGRLENGLTPNQQALADLAPVLRSLSHAHKINLPEIMKTEVESRGSGKPMTLEELYFQGPEGKKEYKRIHYAWKSGLNAKSEQRLAQTNANTKSVLDKCRAYPGSCTQADLDLAQLNHMSGGGSDQNDAYKGLGNLNLAAQTEEGFNLELTEWQPNLRDGSIMSPANITRAKAIGNNTLNTQITGLQKKLEESFTKTGFLSYNQRLLRSLKLIQGDSSTATIDNLTSGDSIIDRLAREITNYEGQRYQHYYGLNPNDINIADSVALDLIRKKEEMGFGKSITDDGAGLWSKDSSGGRPTYAKSLIGKVNIKGFDITTAGLTLNKASLTTLDNKFSAALKTPVHQLPVNGDTYVEKISFTPNLVDLDHILASFTATGFKATSEIAYLAGSMPGISKKQLVKNQALFYINSKDPTHEQLVKTFKLKERVAELDDKDNVTLVQFAKSTGDQYLYNMINIDPDKMTPNQLGRMSIKANQSELINAWQDRNPKDTAARMDATQGLPSAEEEKRDALRARIRREVPGLANASEDELNDWIEKEKEKQKANKLIEAQNYSKNYG